MPCEAPQERRVNAIGAYIPQPKVSALLQGHFADLPLERIFRLLIALDNDVSIVVKPKGEERGHLSVVAR